VEFFPWMAVALEEARAAAARGEVPVGAVVVDRASGRPLARSGNRVRELADPAAHAEILVIRAAAASLGVPRLTDCDLYVSLEPCAMCAGAIAQARLHGLYFGAYDPKGGGVEHGARVFGRSTCNHVPHITGGIRRSAAAALLRDFFQARRSASGAGPDSAGGHAGGHDDSH